MVIGVGNRDIVTAASVLVLVLVSRQYFHCLGLGLGLEGQCLGLGLGTYCLGPITEKIRDLNQKIGDLI